LRVLERSQKLAAKRRSKFIMDSSLLLAYGLIGAGILLLGAELLFPSGLMFALAVAAVGVGVTLTFAHDTTTGIVTLVIVVITLPIIGGLLLHYWPRTRIGRKFILAGPREDATLAGGSVNQGLERLRGRYGKTISALRPAGLTEFDGVRVDTITEGMMIEPGQWVRCIDVQAGRVIVRQVERPGLGDLENAIFN
jgi:membrane-bound serine protease (ClpP class)